MRSAALGGIHLILVLPSGPESGEGSQYQNPLYLSISLYPGAKGYCSEKSGCKDGFVMSSGGSWNVSNLIITSNRQRSEN